MAVTIQDDMFRAAACMSRTQADAFLAALLWYGQTGREPEGNPRWLAAFEGCKERAAMSARRLERAEEDARARSEAARAAANARWSRRGGDACGRNAGASCAGNASESESESEGEPPQACARMAEPEEGRIFFDSADGIHETRRDALAATYAHRTGRGDYGRFEGRAIDGLCGGCDGGRADECFRAIRDALVRWDPEKASSPVPLARKMLSEEVGA